MFGVVRFGLFVFDWFVLLWCVALCSVRCGLSELFGDVVVWTAVL